MTTQAIAAACLCGCGELAKNRYRPGHDARHVSLLVQLVMDADKDRRQNLVHEALDALSEPLQAKFVSVLQTAEAMEMAAAHRQKPVPRRYRACTRRAA